MGINSAAIPFAALGVLFLFFVLMFRKFRFGIFRFYFFNNILECLYLFFKRLNYLLQFVILLVLIIPHFS